MRTGIVAILVGNIVFCIMALTMAFQDPAKDYSKATVDKVNGVYVFYHSHPVEEYTELGIVKPGVTLSDNAGELISALCKRALKSFPNAQGIIITDPDMKDASVIQFK
jgi:hypothetical protein